MTYASQLLSRSHTGRARAHYGDFFSGLCAGRLGQYPALSPGSVNDGVLDGFDASTYADLGPAPGSYVFEK